MKHETTKITDGWALWTGTEGDDPGFVAFFASEKTARDVAEMRDESDGSDWFCDPLVVPALLTPGGIVSANDYQIDTHAKLRAALQAPVCAHCRGSKRVWDNGDMTDCECVVSLPQSAPAAEPRNGGT